MRNLTTGNIGLALAVVLSVAMCAVSFLLGSSTGYASTSGICFPSPEEWTLSPLLSLFLNGALIISLVLAIQILNKTYNFISTTDTVLQCSLLVLICSNVYIDRSVCSSTLIGAAVMIVYFILFRCYRDRKSATSLFIAGTVLSIAGMFQYAAIPFIIALFLASIIIKCMTFKSFIALGIGVITPFWITAGLGLIDITALNLPDYDTVFTYNFIEEGYFLLWLNCGFTTLLFLFISLYNAVRMYAGNTKRRLLNNSTLIFGLVACVCIMFDRNNMPAYLSVLYTSLAVQLANLFALHNLKQRYAVIVILLLLYVGAFVGMLQ